MSNGGAIWVEGTCERCLCDGFVTDVDGEQICSMCKYAHEKRS